jgi:hypothetical protein
MELEQEKRRGRQPKAPPSPDLDQPPKRVLVTHYKVLTSQGRAIAGDKPTLPAHEADDLIEKGHAKPC